MAVFALVLAGVTAVTTLAVVLKCCVLRTGVIAPVRRQDVEAVDAANPRPHVRLFQSLREEVTGLKLEVLGTIPAWVRGSLLRTGPALFEFGDTSYTHPFDGQSMLYMWRVHNGVVTYTNRMLDSTNLRANRRANAIVAKEAYTDPCATMFGRLKNMFVEGEEYENCNVNVDRIAGKLLAMTETPLAVEFDGDSLATVGRVSFSDEGDCSGHLSTAHPQVDRGKAYNIVTRFGKDNMYVIFEVDQDAPPGQAGAGRSDRTIRRRLLAEIPRQRPSYMHSFGITERYIVLSEWAMRYGGHWSRIKTVLNGRPVFDNFVTEKGSGTNFTLIDRRDGSVRGSFTYKEQGAGNFGFHHINAFDDPTTGAVCVDVMTYQDTSYDELLLHALKTSDMLDLPDVRGVSRFTVDPEAGTVTRRTLIDDTLELPRVNDAFSTNPGYRFVYGIAGRTAKKGDVVSGAVKRWPATTTDGSTVDVAARLGGSGGKPASEHALHTVNDARGVICSEPVFVPRPAADGGSGREDDGVVMLVVFDLAAQRSALVVLDATSFTEVGRAILPHHVPFHFHGTFFPTAGSVYAAHSHDAAGAADVGAQAAAAGAGAGAGAARRRGQGST